MRDKIVVQNALKKTLGVECNNYGKNFNTVMNVFFFFLNLFFIYGKLILNE